MICWKDHKEYMQIFDKAVAVLTEALKDPATKFDYMIASGFSGLLMAYPVAAKIDIPCIIVRRAGEKHAGQHAFMPIAGDAKAKILFMDDHISGGNTFRTCHEAVATSLDAHSRWDAQQKSYERQYGVKYGMKWYKEGYGPQPKANAYPHIHFVYSYNPQGGYGNKYGQVVPVKQMQKICGFAPEELPGPEVKSPRKSVPYVGKRDNLGRFAPAGRAFKPISNF